MTVTVIFSDDCDVIEWSELESYRLQFGPKGAGLLALPREWAPPFALVQAAHFSKDTPHPCAPLSLDSSTLERIRSLSGASGKLYIRSSVIGETIWDRGSYKSVVIDATSQAFEKALADAAQSVLDSARTKSVAIVIQTHIEPQMHGEFGNLLRISKTRDHWELSTDAGSGSVARTRLNTQRDEAANPKSRLDFRIGVPRERLFGSVGAWLNNVMLRGRALRLNCEWIATSDRLYLVQVDEESEDVFGVNPFQLRIKPMHRPAAERGVFLLPAVGDAVRDWDKLIVLEELWEPSASHRPTLFYVPLRQLSKDHATGSAQLQHDFETLIGPDNIVVRTSVRAGAEKIVNLPRTEGLSPSAAATWCLQMRDQLALDYGNADQFSFIAHRFLAARSSAWVRAEPGNPLVEIHSLWGLPDALQYCPYDIWEVHLPTETATEYPEYKSHMLIAEEDGKWDYVRITNELGRSLSIGRREAMELATRTAAIADRLGQACHVMWFVGCRDEKDNSVNLPWYWIEAYDSEKNQDRSNYQTVRISSREDLEKFSTYRVPKARCALELMPGQDLMRDMKFIQEVGKAAKQASVPVILAGSTLAHAYFALRREDCTVVTPSEKEHSRIRRNTIFGKIVRDKIPERIAQRKEAEITQKISSRLKKGYLTSKLLEEALEARTAQSHDERRVELADLLEVVRALAQNENIEFQEIVSEADAKRQKAGGFDQGLVLIQTGILSRDRSKIGDSEKVQTQVLARKVSDNTYELPFTFFGFMELDQPRSLRFEELGIYMSVTLKGDRIQLTAHREPEQLELPLDLISDEVTIE